MAKADCSNRESTDSLLVTESGDLAQQEHVVPLFVEYESALTRSEHVEKSDLSNQEVQTVLDALATVIEPVRLAYLWRPALPDVADDMVLEAAVNGRADMLVTINRRDFEPAIDLFALAIVSPAEALGRLRKPS